MSLILNISRKIAEIVCKILSLIMIVLLMVMVVIMFTQISYRVLIGKGFAWAEELLRYLFIWLCFIGTPVAFYYNDFSRFDMLQMKLKGNALKFSLTIIDIALIFMMYFMTAGSLTLVKRQMFQLATTMSFPMGVVYLAITVGGILSVFFLVVKIGLRLVENCDFIAEEGKL